MTLSNIRYLHIIRGFAAFFVLLAHAKWPFWVGGNAYFEKHAIAELKFIDIIGLILAFLSSNGTAMVIVFFVLSGFMITHSYKKNNWQYKQFLINRSLRIYIPYIVSALLAGILLKIAAQSASSIYEHPIKDYHQEINVAYKNGLTPKNFLNTFFFFRSEFNYFGFNYVYWSLLYEMVFYLLFPVILRYYKQCLVISIVLHPIHFFFQADEMPYFLIYFFIKFLFYFSAGVYLYQFLSSKSAVFNNSKFLRKRYLLISIILCFLGIVGAGFTLHKSISYLFATAMAVLWIIYILRYGVKTTILSKAFLTIGEISYSLYLVHVPLLLFIYSLCYYYFGLSTYNSPWIHFIPCLIILPLAYGFYFLFEKLSFKLIQSHKKSLNKDVPVSTQPLAADKVF